MKRDSQCCVRQDIGREFWQNKQRERKSRVVTVDGHQILRENMYDLQSVRLQFTSHRFTEGCAARKWSCLNYK